MLGQILFWTGVVIFLGLFAVACAYYGWTLGKNYGKPLDKNYMALSTNINVDVYKMISEKGGYDKEVDLLSDALTVLNWSLNAAKDGKYICSCEYNGTSLSEFNIETFARVRRDSSPVKYLNRCFDLEQPPDHLENE